MVHLEQQYLHDMEIQCYELVHPQRLNGFQPPPLTLPKSCKLLLVSPQLPQGQIAQMFERVLKSISLPLKHALHIYPEQVGQLDKQQLEWVWFAGCEQQEEVGDKVLASPLLSQIDGNNEQRRALWQQICTYQ